MTNDSAAVRLAKRDAADQEATVRYCTVECRLLGKRGVLLASALPLVDHFRNYAITRGAGSHVVSILANDIIVRNPTLSIPNLFLFYTQVWSALDACVTERTSKHFQAEVRNFFQRNPLSEEGATLLKTPVPVLVRQQDCTALATAAVMHLQNFRSRVFKYTLATVVHIQDSIENGKIFDVRRITELIVRCIVEKSGETVEMSKFKDFADENFAMPEYHTRMLDFITQERGLLGDMLDTYTYEKKVTEDEITRTVEMVSKETKLNRALKQNKYAHELFQHAKRVSDSQLAMLRDLGLDVYLPTHREEDANDGEDDSCLPCEDDNGEDDADEEDDVSRRTIWTRKRRPKPFSLLPIAKLRASMGYYGYTELNSMFNQLRMSLKKRGTKRKTDEDPQSADPLPWSETPDSEKFGILLFDFSKIKGKRYADRPEMDKLGRGWRLANFRTNGVTATLTFVAGTAAAAGAPHVAHLIKAGYQIPIPASKIDKQTRRGLFRVQQNGRNDMSNDMQFSESDSLAFVDPGFVRPVQVSTIGATQSSLDPVQVACDAKYWYITKNEWMQQSGRDAQAKTEERRRLVNKRYSSAINAMSETRRRCSDVSQFDAYAKIAIETLADRGDELMTVKRSLFRWNSGRELKRFLSRIADRLADRGTDRPIRRLSREPTTMPNDIDTLRTELAARRKWKREENPRRIVFFGDGTFSSSMRGNPSMPKKKLLKLLATRTTTILIDEYLTSKMCPCGQDKLKDDTFNKTASKRVRVHETSGGVCDVLKQVNDRDETAAINMALAGLTATRHGNWPTHLCRPLRS